MHNHDSIDGELPQPQCEICTDWRKFAGGTDLPPIVIVPFGGVKDFVKLGKNFREDRPLDD
jgi:hypothetical protein